MCKPNEKHWEVIFNYFDIYPEIPTGRINAGNGKQKMKQFWEELSQQLNSLGYGTKSPDKWQKTWIDFKYNLKKKASDIKKDQVKTGGGPGGGKVLNEIELRALEFLGKGFVHGIGSTEIGLKARINEKIMETEEAASPSLLSLSSIRRKNPQTLAMQTAKVAVKHHGRSETQTSQVNNDESNGRYKKAKYNETNGSEKQKASLQSEHQSQSLLNLYSEYNLYNNTDEDLEEKEFLTNQATFDCNTDETATCTFAASTTQYPSPGTSTEATIATKRCKQNKNVNNPKQSDTSLGVVQLDHNYVPLQKKNKKNENEYNNMYAETISVLKDINNTVDRRLGQIYEVLLERLPKT